MTLVTVADIAGGNAKVALGSGAARVIFITATGGNARLGDTNAGSARGVLLKQDVPFTLPEDVADRTATYDLAAVFAYVPSGTTLTVAWAI